MTGRIVSVQRFSLDDGPGIRTTVFMKGCTLSCGWCHNPESIRPAAQLLFHSDRCCGCGICAPVCPRAAREAGGGTCRVDRRRCDACGACVSICPWGANEIAGRTIEAEALAELLLRDRPFYAASGGGVSFSGGEPLLQADFIRAVTIRLRAEGIGTLVDTAGNLPWSGFETVLESAEVFRYDVKLIDPREHLAAAGAGNRLIRENLARLLKSGKRVWISVPVIPGVNADEAHMEKIAAFLRECRGIERVCLLRYHAMGEGKRALLGEPPFIPNAAPPTEADMHSFGRLFRRALGGATPVEC